MPTVNYGITVTANDACQFDVATGSDIGAAVGDYFGGYLYSAWRFLAVSVPSGANIEAATLTLTHNDAGSLLAEAGLGTHLGRLYGVAQANASALNPNALTSLPKMGVFSSLEFGDPTTVIDVRTIVQEWMTLSGWASGNALAFLADGGFASTESFREFYDRADSSTLCAQLSITYNTDGPPAQGTPTGGTITTDGDYTVHTFTSGGTFDPQGALDDVEYLIVAGGGGGGGSRNSIRGGGGGGAGGLITGSMPITESLTVVVGAGGSGAPANSTTPATRGGDSALGPILTLGGGFGSLGDNSRAAGTEGGSGGGSSGGPAITAGGVGTPGQGFKGGDSAPTLGRGAGGGGGAGGAGGNGLSNGAGAAGAGVSSSITGSATTYAAGGRGGGTGLNNGASGAANTGTGGGGGYGFGSGGNGGSGVVIVRYLTPTAGGGGPTRAPRAFAIFID